LCWDKPKGIEKSRKHESTKTRNKSRAKVSVPSATLKRRDLLNYPTISLSPLLKLRAGLLQIAWTLFSPAHWDPLKVAATL
jgi:hypothetical protein